jgi:hypothetical protein
VTDWKTRAGEYNAESARVYGWTLQRGTRYSGPGDSTMAPPISDAQARLLGIAAADGRIGPDTLRAFMREAKREADAGVTTFLAAFDFDNVSLDRPDPVRPGARRTPPPGVRPPAPTPPAPTPPAPKPPAPPKQSRAPIVVGIAAAAAAAWYYLRGRR